MTPHLKAASEFLIGIGCRDPQVFPSPDGRQGVVKAAYKDAEIVARVEVKEEWGTDKKTPTGTWAAARYPFNSVAFRTSGPQNVSHFILISGDLKRLVLTPKSVIDAAPKAWLRVGDGQSPVQVATVENWTPKVAFFVCGPKGWGKDADNVWAKPQLVSMDPTEFLSSLD